MRQCTMWSKVGLLSGQDTVCVEAFKADAAILLQIQLCYIPFSYTVDIVPSSCGVLVTWCSVSFLDWIGLWDWVNVPRCRIYTVAAFSSLPSHPCRVQCVNQTSRQQG